MGASVLVMGDHHMCGLKSKKRKKEDGERIDIMRRVLEQFLTGGSKLWIGGAKNMTVGLR